MSGSGLVRSWLLILALSVPAWTEASEPEDLARKIDALRTQPALGKMVCGIRVEQVHPVHQLVYEHAADKPLKPASNMKILTSAAAIDILGRDFKYRTLLAQRGKDLIVIGAGDPSIGDPRMADRADESITALFHHWADVLEAMGVKQVPGDLIFDDFIFEQTHIHPSWHRFNLESWYAAPVGGLNFNDNCVDVVAKPASKIGTRAEVTLVPNTPWAKLENRTSTAAKGHPTVTRRGDGPFTVQVKGPVSTPNSRENPISIAVIDPGAFFASTFRTVLAARGIRVVGENRRERVRGEDGLLPKDVRVLASHERPLGDLLWRTNKSSMNLFAEAIFKSLGAYGLDRGRIRTGTNESGRNALKRFLDRRGIDDEGCVFDDGSGLSHENRCTAAIITSVLTLLDARPDRDAWWEDLAVPGEKVGTLRNRLEGFEAAVRAKTGTISGVSALSGYVLGPQGERYAFSVLCNDTHRAKGGTSAAKKLQDDIVKLLAGE